MPSSINITCKSQKIFSQLKSTLIPQIIKKTYFKSFLLSVLDDMRCILTVENKAQKSNADLSIIEIYSDRNYALKIADLIFN